MPNDDEQLWIRATGDVKPLEGRAPPPKFRPKSEAGARETVIIKPENAKQPTKSTAKDIDGKTAEKLRKGQVPIDSRIDLHGMTQDQAHNALTRFMKNSLSAQHRCVLVITGKGKDGQGILRQKLPDWLDDPTISPHILQITSAHQKHGGSGAFYVYLRRQR